MSIVSVEPTYGGLSGVGALEDECLSLVLEGGGMDGDIAVVSRFDPSFVSFESHGAGSQTDPFAFAAEPAQPHLELHTVGVLGVYCVAIGFVGHGHGFVRVVGPLAEVYGVRAPIQQGGAGIEIEVASPSTLDITFIVWSPWGRSKPPVPIDDFSWRLGFCRQPVIEDP